MKKTTLLIIAGILSLTTYGQDTIRKKNNEIIIGIVQEINLETLVYRRVEQQTGPNRLIHLSEVNSITYKDGYTEEFNIQAPVRSTSQNKQTGYVAGEINNTGRVVVVPRRGPDLRVAPGERFPDEQGARERHVPQPMNQNGFFIDGIIGAAFFKENANTSYYDWTTGTYHSEDYLNETTQVYISGRIGNKFFFGSDDYYSRWGIQATWLRAGLAVNEYDTPHFHVDLFNLGVIGVHELKENSGIEYSVNGGFSGFIERIRLGDIDGTAGYSVSANIKYCYKQFRVGVEYSRMEGLTSSSNPIMNVVGLTIGRKL
jgi:hypothetical protein